MWYYINDFCFYSQNLELNSDPRGHVSLFSYIISCSCEFIVCVYVYVCGNVSIFVFKVL